MGTNFYFMNTKSKLIAEEKNKKVEILFESLNNSLLGLGFDDSEVKDQILDIKWNFETRADYIHIGKRTGNLKPLFHSNDYFNTLPKMKSWYESNKDEWIILDEYDTELTWLELEEELINWDGEKSHFELPDSYYYVDEDGNEWSHYEFS